MDESKRFEGVLKREMLTDGLSLRVLGPDEGGDEQGRTVELSFSSETPVMMYGAYEVLSHKKDAVMLDRINNGGCLLFNHNRNIILGTVIKAQISKKRGIAIVRFDDDEESLKYLGKVKSGSLRNVSVGYKAHQYKKSVLKKGDDMEITYTATRWEPVEISLVSVPADISVGVGRSLGMQRPTKHNHVSYRLKINQNLIKSISRRKM